jgi:hypothetical protein
MNFDTHFNKGSVLEKDESEESNLDVYSLESGFSTTDHCRQRVQV